jgi:phosphate transport system ATP-binding protein
MAKRIEVSGLHAYYGSTHAIEDISMSVEPRSVTAFIGPSGCGKSTLLRTLNRMHEVIPGARVEGKVLLDDTDLYASTVDPVAVRRMIGMVFQRPNPFPTMSIYDNVASGLRLNGVRGKRRLDEVVERSLRGANLWDEVKDRLGRPGAGLSGGQQQRLCIARAIAVEPQVVLMDEPCSALDPISTLAIEDLIAQLKEHYTIVIVTHNMQQAARVSDRTAFFNIAGVGKPGRLIEIDDTNKIFTNPSEPATEDYITGRFGLFPPPPRTRSWSTTAGPRRREPIVVEAAAGAAVVVAVAVTAQRDRGGCAGAACSGSSRAGGYGSAAAGAGRRRRASPSAGGSGGRGRRPTASRSARGSARASARP